MEPALKAIADYGIVVVVLVAGGAFLGYLIRDYINDLKKQRDLAFAGWQGSIGAIEKLSDALRDRNDFEERQARTQR